MPFGSPIIEIPLTDFTNWDPSAQPWTLFFDNDGTTGWVFQYFSAGFARFNLSDGTAVVQDNLLGIPGFAHSTYTTEDGTALFVQDDQGHYYSCLDQVTLYKSHVAAGPLGNLFNGYMVDDATLAVSFGNIEGWNNPILPASDGNRYLAVADEVHSVKVYDVGTMTLVGTYTNGDHRFWRAFMDKNGDFWFVTINLGNPNGCNLVFWHPANGATLGALNVTVNAISPATLGTGTGGIEFGTYIATDHSVILGNSLSNTGDLTKISLTSFTRMALHLDDLTTFYNGTFDSPISAFELKPQGGLLGIPGDVNPETHQVGGVFNTIDPATLVVTHTRNVTQDIISQGGLDAPPHTGSTVTVYNPFANNLWNGSVLMVTYEFTGSSVYLYPLSFAAPVLNSATALLVSSEAPSNFEDEVTFTATVSDPITGDPNPNTAPHGIVQFVADGTFGFGSDTLAPLASTPSAISATATVATYIGPNSFTAGQKVTITGFGGGFTQFNQSNVLIATATLNSFTVNGSYTVQVQVNQDGVATSTSASRASATTTVLIPGLHTIIAHYLGDTTPTTGHNLADSNTLTQQVVNVPTNTTQELPGFALIGSFSPLGDSALPPQAQVFAIPVTAAPHQSINLLWNTLNVAFIRITGNNGVDYQPLGFDTGFVSTSGSGIYVVGSGFTATITLTLQAYDSSHAAIAGLVSQVLITIT